MAGPYDIAIHMSLEDEISGALTTLAANLLGLEGSIGRIQKMREDMGGAAKLALGGAVAMIAGDEVIKGLGDIAEKGEALIRVQNQLVSAGLAYNDVLSLTNKAFDDITAKVPTATGADVLKSVLELRSVLGDTDRALGAAPFSLKLDAVENNMTGGHAEGEGFKLWRALEMKGMTTSASEGDQQAFINRMAQDIIGSGGKINADTFQAMAKTGGNAWIHASPEFLTGAGAVIGGDLGGDRAGTAMNTLYQTTSGAVSLSQQQMNAWQSLDLLNMDKVHKQHGGSYSMDPGAIKGAELAISNPAEWASSILKPALDKAAGGNEETRDHILSQLGRNRNTIRMLTMLTDPGFMDQIEKDQKLWAQGQGVEGRYAEWRPRDGQRTGRQSQ
jgi:hypothetical protein